jgi:hypothetical protein
MSFCKCTAEKECDFHKRGGYVTHEDDIKCKPRYSGPNRSGICKCGHSWDDHHLCCVMNEDYSDQTREAYIPQECEFYGFNETGGLDDDGNSHCFGYVDSMEGM